MVIKVRTALILGYPGWLASELAKKLSAQGMKLDGLGLQLPNMVESNEIENYYRLDMSNFEELRNAPIRFENYDLIVNCASIIHPKRPLDFFKINALSSLHLVLTLNNANYRGEYIYISSNAAQGFTNEGVIANEDTPDTPKSIYGRSKLIAENFLKLYAKFNFNIVRPCMFYSDVVPKRHKIVRALMKLSVFPTFASNNAYRSVTSVSDICDVCVALSKGAAQRQTFYVCDDQVMSTNEVISEMARKAGIPKLKLIRMPKLIARAAYICDNLLCRINIYNMPLHLLGESDWNVGYSSKKASAQLGVKFSNYGTPEK